MEPFHRASSSAIEIATNWFYSFFSFFFFLIFFVPSGSHPLLIHIRHNGKKSCSSLLMLRINWRWSAKVWEIKRMEYAMMYLRSIRNPLHCLKMAAYRFLFLLGVVINENLLSRNNLNQLFCLRLLLLLLLLAIHVSKHEKKLDNDWLFPLLFLCINPEITKLIICRPAGCYVLLGYMCLYTCVAH